MDEDDPRVFERDEKLLDEDTPVLWRIMLVVRFIMVFSPGYIHPDEFFQSSEVTSNDIFGFRNTYVPWEFTEESPCRSIIPPTLISGIPFRLLEIISHTFGIAKYSSILLLILPRIMVFAFSLSIGKFKNSMILLFFQ